MSEPKRGDGFLEWVKDRPWILLIGLLAIMMVLAILTLIIAQANRPVLIPR